MSPAKGHALITGGAIRIGRVIALTLAKSGWDLTIHCHASKDEADQLAEEIKAIGRRVRLVQADLENPIDLDILIPENTDHPLTALVNNASLFLPDTKDPSGLRHDVVNYQAPLKLTEKLSRQLPEGQIGRVVHILDCCPFGPQMSSYAKSRQKLQTAVPEQARHYGSRLLVNAVSPGPTLINPRQSQAHFTSIINRMPSQKPCTPEAVAQAILLFLEGGRHTGEIVTLDGDEAVFSS